MALEITDDNFQNDILEAEVAVVDFWAAWCGPCRMVGPYIEQLANQYEGQATIGKLDVDANQKTAMEYNIRSIPAVLYFKNGRLVDKQVGAAPKKVYEQKLQDLLD